MMVERELDNCTRLEPADPRWEKGYLPNSCSELFGSVDGGYLSPCRLINTDAIENGREFVTVLGIVDHLRIGPQNVETVLLEPEGDVLRELSWNTTVRCRGEGRAMN
jgi:hypothetical protein